MQCDVCHSKEAKVFLTQIVKGKIQKVNLCNDCSHERGVDDPAGFALTELLTGLGTTEETEKPGNGSHEPKSAEPAQKCPVCGFTQADFKKTARLGCSECYRTFSDSLGNLLKAMHKGSSHTGKMPARLAQTHAQDERLRSLQDDLQRAVTEENYESAASLRDQIRRLASN